jgi:hypothetical protein
MIVHPLGRYSISHVDKAIMAVYHHLSRVCLIIINSCLDESVLSKQPPLTEALRFGADPDDGAGGPAAHRRRRRPHSRPHWEDPRSLQGLHHVLERKTRRAPHGKEAPCHLSTSMPVSVSVAVSMPFLVCLCLCPCLFHVCLCLCLSPPGASRGPARSIDL